MNHLKNRRLLIGMTGGIAVAKSLELVTRLQGAGADVRIVLTANAGRFISDEALRQLGSDGVYRDLFDDGQDGMAHIELARWADRILVAPAGANFMAKLAHGFADDLLSTLCLASERPPWLAPAMNQAMWLNPATQANASSLTARGIRLLGPAVGALACGETGPGRLLEVDDLFAALADDARHGQRLRDVSVLITAGPTREAIDPVRFIGNRSSGKMGFALAAAAQACGARVTLVSGPVSLPSPAGVERIDVISAADMYQAVMQRIDQQQIYISAAAIADYRVETVAPQKIKKDQQDLSLNLSRNPDLLAAVAARQARPYCVGFAAETEALAQHARDKLVRKHLDMIAANPVGESQGFDSDDNQLLVLSSDATHTLPAASKIALARDLIHLIADDYHAKRSSQTKHTA